MGYSTDFTGTLKFNRPVSTELKEYVNKFADTRHMRRDVSKIKNIYPDWKQDCFKGELGVEGEYFINDDGFFGQTKDDSIIDYNRPPETQPGLWCQWIINDRDELEWDGCEKFYNYIEWLQYLIDNFFEPAGYKLNGKIAWQGEEEVDSGIIEVVDNNINVIYD